MGHYDLFPSFQFLNFSHNSTKNHLPVKKPHIRHKTTPTPPPTTSTEDSEGVPPKKPVPAACKSERMKIFDFDDDDGDENISESVTKPLPTANAHLSTASTETQPVQTPVRRVRPSAGVRYAGTTSGGRARNADNNGGKVSGVSGKGSNRIFELSGDRVYSNTNITSAKASGKIGESSLNRTGLKAAATKFEDSDSSRTSLKPSARNVESTNSGTHNIGTKQTLLHFTSTAGPAPLSLPRKATPPAQARSNKGKESVCRTKPLGGVSSSSSPGTTRRPAVSNDVFVFDPSGEVAMDTIGTNSSTNSKLHEAVKKAGLASRNKAKLSNNKRKGSSILKPTHERPPQPKTGSGTKSKLGSKISPGSVANSIPRTGLVHAKVDFASRKRKTPCEARLSLPAKSRPHPQGVADSDDMLREIDSLLGEGDRGEGVALGGGGSDPVDMLEAAMSDTLQDKVRKDRVI